MGLSNQADRLEEYRTRLETGDADRITRSDVDRIIDKLERKRTRLQERLRVAASPAEAERRRRKLTKAEQLIDHARWLRDQL
jgi:hypothetical protein